MDSNLRSTSPDNADAKTTFRKPSNDVANRKYRRRSPDSGSSSSGSPKHVDSPSPMLSREDSVRASDHRHTRKDDQRDRESGRSQYGRTGDSYRHSDRQSSRRRNDDYRHDMHADDEDNKYRTLSSKTGRESRDGTRSEYTRQESEHNRSRDYLRDVDKYSREKYDVAGHRSKDKEREDQKYKNKDSYLPSAREGFGRRERERPTRDLDDRDENRDHRRSVGDCKDDRMRFRDEPRGHRTEPASRRDNVGHHLKEAHKSDLNELDDQKYAKEDKKYDNRDNQRDADRYIKRTGGQSDDKTAFVRENEESPAKKSKLFSLDKGTDHKRDVPKSTAVGDEMQPLRTKQAQVEVGKMTTEGANSSDAGGLYAAKVAAMKAAELVNKNLVGVGCMSTDQKKKLLWGSKKSTTAEEPVHRWDATLFPDRERQEKFNKLMGVKGEVKVERKPENQEGSSLLQSDKQKELQMDLEKQYTAGLRRRDGRTVGLGL